jgi:hypothetical protein
MSFAPPPASSHAHDAPPPPPSPRGGTTLRELAADLWADWSARARTHAHAHARHFCARARASVMRALLD